MSKASDRIALWALVVAALSLLSSIASLYFSIQIPFKQIDYQVRKDASDKIYESLSRAEDAADEVMAAYRAGDMLKMVDLFNTHLHQTALEYIHQFQTVGVKPCFSNKERFLMAQAGRKISEFGMNISQIIQHQSGNPDLDAIHRASTELLESLYVEKQE